MQRLSVEEAKAKIRELYRAKLETKSHMQLLDLAVNAGLGNLDKYTPAMLSNAVSALSDGEFGCERPDLGDAG